MTGAQRHPRRRGEYAFAMPVAITLGVVALLLISAGATYTLGRAGDHDRRRDRVVAMPVVDSAVTRIKVGLEQNLMAEHRNYTPTLPQLQAMVAGTSAEVLTGSFITPAIPPGMPNVTIREPMDAGRAGYWQMLRVFEPDYDDPSDEGVVVVYLRAWIGTAANPGRGTEPRLVRAEFRPGRFADYQAVIDGPIIFGPGASLNGPIHSNGFADERANFTQALTGIPERVGAIDGVVVPCSGNAQITTAQGAVNRSAFSGGCDIKTNTGRYVNMLAAEESFDRMKKACADSAQNVRCYDATYEGSNVSSSLAQKPPDLRGYRVKLSGGSIEVSGYEINPLSESPGYYPVSGAGTINTPPGSTTVLLFADSVLVEGTTNQRVTIAARKPGLESTNAQAGAANIYLTGNTGHSGAGSVLGLVAQGGVILDAIKNSAGAKTCITDVRAAIMAMSGTLSIDPRYTTRLYQQGGADCASLSIRGSIAAHRSPVLYWSWKNVPGPGYVGYKQRNYSWTESFTRNPPPYYPTTDTWESRHIRPANLDCFSGGTITDQDC